MPTGDNDQRSQVDIWGPDRQPITIDRPLVIGQVHFIGLLDNPRQISRKHVTLFGDETGRLRVIDLASTNGTKVNGRAIEPGIPVPIEPGVDSIQLGSDPKATVGVRFLEFKLPAGFDRTKVKIGSKRTYLIVIGGDNSPVQIDVDVQYVDKTMLPGGGQAPGLGPATQEQPRPLIEGEGRGPDASDQIA